jgi:DNA-binding SARP family transcriptional activator
MLEIALFGEPRFTVDRRPHAFVAPPKALPMLAYLLLHRNAPIGREALASLLWPETDEETARTNLRRHLHYLRKTLPEGEWLRIDTKSVQWNVDAPYRFDVAEFEQQSKIAQMRPLAVKLYTGDLYRACEEEWLYFDRERLRNMQITNLAALAEDAERALDHVRAASYARELLELEPWREDAVRILMRARMQTGDRGGALAEYERFQVRLDDEMGVEPMPETRALYEAFARQEPQAPSAPPRGRTLVGRAGELQALLLQWRSVESGHAAFALIGGEAGVGKTALIRELGAEVMQGGGVVLTAQIEPQGDAPYAAILRALAQARLDRKLRASASLPAGGLIESAERGAFFASVAGALNSMAEQSPLLLTIEDLHWAGGDTIALIEFLERRLRDARILIVCSYRDDAVAPEHPLRALRRYLSARSSCTHVALNRLTSEDVTRIVRRRLGETPGDDVAQMLYRRSQGNAFFLTELLEHHAAGDDAEVPGSIRDLVAERFERLTPGAREVVSRFAAVGSAISAELSAALLTGEAAALQRALAELVETRFLREERTASGITYAFSHDVVRESLYAALPEERRARLHAEIAAAMEGLSPSRYAAALADHYERAGDSPKAARAYLRAAAQAVGGFANDDAERFALKAVALDGGEDVAIEAYAQLDTVYYRTGRREMQRRAADEMDAIAERSGKSQYICEAVYHRLAQAFYESDPGALQAQLERLRRHLPDAPVWAARLEAFTGIYQSLSGNPDAAWETMQRALALCTAAGHAFGELFCYVRLLEMCDGHTRPYTALLEQARALERRLGDPDSAFLLADAEAKLFLHVDRTQCQHSALRIIDAGERTGDHIYMGLGHMYLAAVATYRFEPEPAERHFEAAYAALQDSVRRADIARLHRFRGLYHFSTGDGARGLEDSLASLEAARAGHAHELSILAAGNALYGYMLTQRYDAAERLASEVKRELEAVRGHYFAVQHMMLSLGMVLGAQGRFSEAIPLMKQSFDEHAIRGHKLHAAWAGTSLAYQLLRAGRAEEGRPYIEGYLKLQAEMLDEGWMPQETLWQAAQVLHALNRRDEAHALLSRASGVVASRLAALPAEEQQRRFLDFPVNREIMRAHGDNVWPTF